MAFTVAYTYVAAEGFQALPRRVKHQVRGAVATLTGDPRGAAAADWLKRWPPGFRVRRRARQSHRVLTTCAG